MFCEVDEQLVSADTGQKRNILERGSGARGALLITQQHIHLNDGRGSDES